MKKILLFLLLPFAASAQIEFGLNGGIAPYTMASTPYFTALPGTKYTTAGYYDATASFQLTHFLRIGFDYGYGNFVFPSPSPLGVININIANPLTSYSLFADYTHRIGRSAFHAGIIGGIAGVKNNDMDYDGSVNGKGIIYGIHIGYAYNLSKHISLFAQIGYYELRLNVNSYVPNNNYNNQYYYASYVINNMVTYYPLQLGIHYKIRIRKGL